MKKKTSAEHLLHFGVIYLHRFIYASLLCCLCQSLTHTCIQACVLNSEIVIAWYDEGYMYWQGPKGESSAPREKCKYYYCYKIAWYLNSNGTVHVGCPIVIPVLVLSKDYLTIWGVYRFGLKPDSLCCPNNIISVWYLGFKNRVITLVHSKRDHNSQWERHPGVADGADKQQ